MEYFKAFKGTCKLDRSRALDYVKSIKTACFIHDLDEERYFAQIDWESAFVNNIKDRKLPFHSWSYGLTGMQVQTAHLYAPKVMGRQLIMDFNLNVVLGARHMRHLIDKAGGDLHQAEMAYNAGWAGMLQGKGSTYPASVDMILKKYQNFKGRQ